MMASYPSKHLEDTVLDLLLRWKVESLLKSELNQLLEVCADFHG